MIRNKYGNKKYKGFDSKREAKRYCELVLLEQAGVIHDLMRQASFVLIPAQFVKLWKNGEESKGKCIERSCKYIADFTYRENGELVVEDAKGVRTPDYVIKRKLMLYMKGIRIKEV